MASVPHANKAFAYPTQSETLHEITLTGATAPTFEFSSVRYQLIKIEIADPAAPTAEATLGADPGDYGLANSSGVSTITPASGVAGEIYKIYLAQL